MIMKFIILELDSYLTIMIEIKRRAAIKEILLNPSILNQCIARHNEDANPKEQINERTIIKISYDCEPDFIIENKGKKKVYFYVIELNLTYNGSKQYFAACFYEFGNTPYGSFLDGNEADVPESLPKATEDMCKQPLNV